MSELVSVGYEGMSMDDFLGGLKASGVEVLADVRLNAISRRRGFSKTALTLALESVGIEYRHYRSLGNPKHNRAAFQGPDRNRGRQIYRTLIEASAAKEALVNLSDLAGQRVTAVLCFERDEKACHRAVVLQELRTLVGAGSEPGDQRRARG